MRGGWFALRDWFGSDGGKYTMSAVHLQRLDDFELTSSQASWMGCQMYKSIERSAKRKKRCNHQSVCQFPLGYYITYLTWCTRLLRITLQREKAHTSSSRPSDRPYPIPTYSDFPTSGTSEIHSKCPVSVDISGRVG